MLYICTPGIKLWFTNKPLFTSFTIFTLASFPGFPGSSFDYLQYTKLQVIDNWKHKGLPSPFQLLKQFLCLHDVQYTSLLYVLSMLQCSHLMMMCKHGISSCALISFLSNSSVFHTLQSFMGFRIGRRERRIYNLG